MYIYFQFLYNNVKTLYVSIARSSANVLGIERSLEDPLEPHHTENTTCSFTGKRMISNIIYRLHNHAGLYISRSRFGGQDGKCTLGRGLGPSLRKVL